MQSSMNSSDRLSGQITMRKVDGWKTLADKPSDHGNESRLTTFRVEDLREEGFVPACHFPCGFE